jgi:hypothetical protein
MLEPCLQLFLLWLIWKQGGFIFCPGQPGPQSSYFTLPVLAGMTGVCHHTQLFSIEVKSVNIFAQSGIEP